MNPHNRYPQPRQETKSPAGVFYCLTTPPIAKSPHQSPQLVMTPHHIYLYALVIERSKARMAEAQHE